MEHPQPQPQPTPAPPEPGNRMVNAQSHKGERLPLDKGTKVIYSLFFVCLVIMAGFAFVLWNSATASQDSLIVTLLWMPIVGLGMFVYGCVSLGFSFRRVRLAKKSAQKPALLDYAVQAGFLIMLAVPLGSWWYVANISNPKTVTKQNERSQEIQDARKRSNRLSAIGDAVVLYVPVANETYEIKKSGITSDKLTWNKSDGMYLQYELVQKSTNKKITVSMTSNRSTASYCFSGTDVSLKKIECKDITKLGVKAGTLSFGRGSYAYVRDTIYYDIDTEHLADSPKLTDQEVVDLINSFQSISSGSI